MLTGVNKQIIERIGNHKLLKSCSKKELEESLSILDSNNRRYNAVQVISKIWKSVPGLGVSPLLQELKNTEDKESINKGYRDHVIHSLQVFLLGIDILENLPDLRDKIEENKQFDNIERAWTVAALGHDHGYLLSPPGKGRIPENIQEILKNPLKGLGYDEGKVVAFESLYRSYAAGPALFTDSLEQLKISSKQILNFVNELEVRIPKNILGRTSTPIKNYLNFYKNVLHLGHREHGIESALILLQLYYRLYYFLDSVEWKECVEENAYFIKWDIRKELRKAEKDFYAGCVAIALHNICSDLKEDKYIEAEALYQLDLKNYRLTLENTPLAWLLAFCDTLQEWNRQQPSKSIGETTRYSMEPEDISIEYNKGFMYISFIDKNKTLEESAIDLYWVLRKQLKKILNPEDFSFLQEGPCQNKSRENLVPISIVSGKKNYMDMGEISSPTFSEENFVFLYEASKSKLLNSAHQPVCVIYTGGSVGMVPEDKNNDASPLVTAPLSGILPYLKNLIRLKFDIHFFETPEVLDSSNIGIQDWQEIGQLIKNLYKYYQGFVILHGTDTMTYTASALSFMFENLEKPIVFTGAERPLCLPQSDAESNIMRSLMIAAPSAIENRVVPEVCIFFGTRLLRANRTKKTHALDFNGFESPNYHHLGRVEDKVEIFEHFVRQNKIKNTNFDYKPSLDPRVAIFEIYPNLKSDECENKSTIIELFRHILLDEKSQIMGLILKTYGTGNAPSMPYDFLKIIQEAIQVRGKVIVNLSHCLTGEVEVRLFETNVRLFELGVINGGDMTVEAAYTKLMHLLKVYPNNRQDDDGSILGGFDVDTIKSEFQINMRGELRYSARSVVYPKEVNKKINIIRGLFTGENQKINLPEDANVTKAYIRITNLNPEIRKGDKIKLSFFINASGHLHDLLSRNAEQFKIETTTRIYNGDPITFNIDATNKVKELLIGQVHCSLQIRCDDEIRASIGTLELSIFTEENIN